jgi:multicomponent Na+:H+ antiporter subunit E
MWESIRGGVDVARRVFGSKVRVAPGFIGYRSRLHDPRARMLFVNSVSLVPGTLVVDLQDDRLQIHALDQSGDLTHELRRLERAIGRIYREDV